MRLTGFDSLVEVLRERARVRPDRPVYTFLDDGEREGARLSYAELDRRARGIAARLQDRGLRGQRALLLYPQGLEFMAAFFGCLYAGVAAVPAYPPDPRRLIRSLGRLQQIVDDAAPAVVLTNRELDRAADAILTGASDVRLPPRLVTDEPETLAAADAWRDPGVGRGQLAFLQYTSGSTGLPKGVVVSHGNLLANLDSLAVVCETGPDTGVMSWLPLYHDMGLIGAALQAVAVGSECVLMDPVSFIQRPLRWLRAITRYRSWLSGGPNFGYELCVRKIRDDELSELDLSSWGTAFNGAEPIRAATLKRFVERFERCGLPPGAMRPCYGLAEGTLMVSFVPRRPHAVQELAFDAEALRRGEVRAAPPASPLARGLVGCGPPGQGWQVRIVDPETLEPAAQGAIGEIWARGASVAGGYWGREEETRAVFQARPASGAVEEEAGFLRTGDLGFLWDGELVVTGRIKDLIIVRGLNHHPQDIEDLIEGPGLRPGGVVALALDDEGEERLVVVAEVDRRPGGDERNQPLDVESLGARCARAVTQGAGVELHRLVLVEPGTVQKTSSGKLQRGQVRRDLLAGRLLEVGSYGPPPRRLDAVVVEPSADLGTAAASPGRQGIESWLRERVGAVIGLAARQVDRAKPFSEYGIDSLQGVTISGELADWLRRPLPPTLLWDQPTIAALARHLADEAGEGAPPASRPLAETGDARVALVGIGCRFPGAAGPEELWRLLRQGGDAITEVPAGRFSESVGAAEVRWGGFLADIAGFDHEFFGISRREAERIDPQQRLLLEVSWEALEDAGLVPERLERSATGVFVGISSYDYGRLQLGANDAVDLYSNTGSALAIAANRVSYLFDWRGPSVAVDTACSGSLVAVHLACESLARGECDVALAGGVNLILSPAVTRAFALMGVMAADGRCKSFGAGADGYVRSEGAGMIVLKRLDRAVADGDRIYSILWRGQSGRPQQRSHGAQRRGSGGGARRRLAPRRRGSRRHPVRRGARQRDRAG
jgi:acyl-CoA synthetase (AMP-forming)/AMP-acid ligase II/acyl carrier protein